MTLAERLDKTKFSRVNSISLIKNQETLLKCLTPLEKNFPNRVILTRKVWNQAEMLLAIASADRFELTADKWKLYATEFATNLVKLYSEKCVTSYLHCFVYHYGYWLEKFGAIEKLGNYSIETNVKWVKDNYARASNHGGGVAGSDSAPLAQLLSKHFRMQRTFKKDLLSDGHVRYSQTLSQTDIPS